MSRGWKALRDIICKENEGYGTILLWTATVSGPLSGVRDGAGGGVAGGTPPNSTRDGSGG